MKSREDERETYTYGKGGSLGHGGRASLFLLVTSLALQPAGYDRWMGLEPDPHDLLISYPSEPMTMWPISTRVNKPENDDPSLLDRTGVHSTCGLR